MYFFKKKGFIPPKKLDRLYAKNIIYDVISHVKFTVIKWNFYKWEKNICLKKVLIKSNIKKYLINDSQRIKI